MNGISLLKKLKKYLKAQIYFYYVNYIYDRKISKICINMIREDSLKKLSKSEKSEINHFWKQYFGDNLNMKWHRAFKSVNKFSYKYIPENIFYSKIEPKLNRLEHGLWDKNYYSFWFPIQQPETIFRNINGNFYSYSYDLLSISKVTDILKNCHGEYFVKPSIDTGGGRGILKLNIINGILYQFNDSNELSLSTFIKLYPKDYILQKKVEQHENLDNIYPFSLNTIRLLTYRRPNNEIVVLHTIVKMGNNKSYLDNEGAFGISIGVNTEGELLDFAVCTKTFGRYFDKHPYTNIKFAGVKVPNYRNIKKACINLHNHRVHYQNLVSWDMTVDKEGNIILIELNLSAQGILFFQANNGPLFGNYTEEVLESVFVK